MARSHRSRLRSLLLAAAALTALVAVAAATASRSTLETRSASNSPAPLSSAPYALVGLSPLGRTKAVATLRKAGAVELSHSLAIWRLESSSAERLFPSLERAGLVRTYQPDRVLTSFASPYKGADPMLGYEWWLS